MKDAIQVIADLSSLVFVVGTMLSLGLSLTLRQILHPLQSTGFVMRILVANFVLVPLLAYLLKSFIPLDPSATIGLILLATAAGAPILPKLAEASKSDVPLSAGLMVLLAVASILYMPIVIPLLLPGVQVAPMDMAGSLINMMLVPLVIGLIIHARYRNVADSIQPYMAQASSTSLIALVVLLAGLNARSFVATIGSGIIAALLIMIAVSWVIGYGLAGQSRDAKLVSGFATAKRNFAAAMVVAAANFSDDPKVLTIVLLGAMLMIAILMVAAQEIGRSTTRLDGKMRAEEATV
ncbi:bile acid:sodium symporter family protein [Synechococcus sp. 1G10]|uniref:bile acid:sodium symporter family protein n=1 Tax=Synechococcus sp. 1G10 TaxID=2025605 RepID=UPI000B99390E|nr:bile acid:sodium symporter [Synechococcus sp. 1G10]